MKKYITVLLVIALCGKVIGASLPTISWPRDYSVFQRNTTTTGGATTVYFSGQIFDMTSVSYRIERLNADGSYNNDWQTWQALPGGVQPIGSSSSGTFHFSLSVPTGWYRVTFRDGVSQTVSVKFGVGEVFVIAGQSNAQGAGSDQFINGLTSYDCVVGNKNYIGSDLTLYPTIDQPVFGVINSGNMTIGPRGDRPWYYQSLGNQIATREAGQVIPVCFFNVSHGGSSINNWYDSMQRTKTMFSSNYANTMVTGSTSTTTNPWNPPPFDNRFPYIDLKNILSFYGNMFGVRAVIWHQGEAETRTLLSQYLSSTFGSPYIPSSYSVNNYDTYLNAIIADTRTILPNLPWAISKVSLIDENTTSSVAKYNIVNNSGNLIVPGTTTVNIGNSVIQEQTNVSSTSAVSWASQNSDSFIWTSIPTTNKRSDGTHFSTEGLKSMSEDVYSNISSILSKSPVLPASVPRMMLNRVAERYYSIWTASFTSYLWHDNADYRYYQTQTNMGNNWVNNGGGPDWGYNGFSKDGNGRIFKVVPEIRFQGVNGGRVGVLEQHAVETSVVYPNPVLDENSLHVNFRLIEASPVKIQLVRENGEVATELIEPKMEPGSHSLAIPLKKLRASKSQSVIIYHLKTNEHNETKKILLIR